MRLWSLHPQYLDAKGLVALWREGLLAQNVLLNKTKGYKHHPQLERFKSTPDPLATIGAYLIHVEKEASARNYHFNKEKIIHTAPTPLIPLTHGQLLYEWQHLQNKLEKRDPEKLLEFRTISSPLPHPLFTLTEGPIASWEVQVL